MSGSHRCEPRCVECEIDGSPIVEFECLAAMNAAGAVIREMLASRVIALPPTRLLGSEWIPPVRLTAAERGRLHRAREDAIVERKPTGEGLHPLSDRWRTMQKPASQGDERP